MALVLVHVQSSAQFVRNTFLVTAYINPQFRLSKLSHWMHVFFKYFFCRFPPNYDIAVPSATSPILQSEIGVHLSLILGDPGASSRDNIFGRKFTSSAKESLLSEKTKIQINTSTERNRVAKRSMKSFLLCNVPELNKDLQTSRFRVTFSHLFIQNSSNLLVSKLVFHEFWKLWEQTAPAVYFPG